MVQRSILFDLKDEIVPPTNETVTQVFARLSAYRDSMDGPQVSATDNSLLPARFSKDCIAPVKQAFVCNQLLRMLPWHFDTFSHIHCPASFPLIMIW